MKKFSIIIAGLIILFTNIAFSKSQWVPVVMDDIMTFVQHESAHDVIGSIDVQTDNDTLTFTIEGNFDSGSHYSIYIDSDNNPNTGYSRNQDNIKGADYLLQGHSLYKHRGDGDHWNKIGDVRFHSSSTKTTLSIDQDKLPLGSTIKYTAVVTSHDWKTNYSYGKMIALSFADQTNMIYVDILHGDNGFDGSLSKPLKSIQAAIDKAKAGDHIYIKRGIYHERVALKSSGVAGKPIVIEGEKDANGKRLVTVHGGDKIRVNWQRADEIGEGVYKTTELPNSYAMTIFQDGVFKDIPRLDATKNSTTDPNHGVLRVWLDGKHATNPNQVLDYRFFLAIDADYEGRGYYTDEKVKFWDGIEGFYAYDPENNTTYIRFRNGEDPNSLDLYRSGGRVNAFGVPVSDLLHKAYYKDLQEDATFKIHNQSYITIKGLNIDGAQDGVLIDGENAHHNIVEDNEITNGQRRVFIARMAHDNIVRDNKLHMRLLSSYHPGAWYDAQHLVDPKYEYIVAEHIYISYKRWIGFSTFSPLDDMGIFVDTAGGGNDVYRNEVYDTLGGIAGRAVGDVKIHDNTFYNISSISTGAGLANSYIYNNRFYNVHIGIRIGLLEKKDPDLPNLHKKLYFFNNIVFNPPGSSAQSDIPDRLAGISEGLYLDALGPHNPDGSRKKIDFDFDYFPVYIYHNTFVNDGKNNQASSWQVEGEEDVRLDKDVLMVNNLFYNSYNSYSYPVYAKVGNNWFNHKNEMYSNPDINPYDNSNIVNEDENFWDLPTQFPHRMLDFSLPKESSAEGAGIDLSKPFTVDGENFQPLYGIDEAYYKGHRPNIGAVQ